MRKVRVSLVLLAFLVTVTALNGCWPFPSHKLCCEQYSVESNQATYCNNHRDALMKYVRDTDDDSVMRTRLGQMEVFYELVEDCKTVECIEIGVGDPATPDEFAERYQTEHDYAERDALVPENEKAKLILCGFKHAIEGLNKTL